MMKRNLLIALITAATIACIAYPGSSQKTKTALKQSSTDTLNVQNRQTARLPKLLDLGSKSCIPCKAMAPILDSLRQLYMGKAEVEFIDVKENRQASLDHKITLIPTQIFFDTTGAEVFRHIGFFPADSITVHLKQVGAKL
jgi:thioredoxin 1